MVMPQRFPIIDCHFHMHMPVDKLGDIRNLGNFIQKCGLRTLNIVCSTGSADVKPERLNENLVGALCKAMYPELIYAFAGLTHFLPGLPRQEIDFTDQARKLINIGFDGFKMIEGKPTIRKKLPEPLDAPLYDGFFSLLEKEQIPLLYHIADPEEFWDPSAVPDWAQTAGWNYTDGSWPAKEQLYREVDNILTKHPGLAVIFAHFYFLSADLDRAAAFLDKWPRVSFDITPGVEMFFNFSRDPGAWRSFFIRYQDRILFGTDNSNGSDPEYAVRHVGFIRSFLESGRQFSAWNGQPVKGLGLGPDVLEKIYYKNFQHYTGKTPKPFNRTQAKKIFQELARSAGIANDFSRETDRFSALIEEI